MSDPNGRTCGRGIRISSSTEPGQRRDHEGRDAPFGPELDGVRNLLLRQRDARSRDVHGDSVALFFRTQDLVVGNRDDLAPLLYVDNLLDCSGQGAQLHKAEYRVVRILAIGGVEVTEPG